MKKILAVGAAGSLGALCRSIVSFGMADLIPFPIGTLSVNLLGTFLLCFLARETARALFANETIYTAITTGFIGSFTTFSALSMETLELLQAGAYSMAGLYVLTSITGGVAAAVIGFGKKAGPHGVS